jgi:L-methionine (R)-S-oxide reductase
MLNTQQKEGRYLRILSQFESLIVKCNDPLARMATLTALLHHKMKPFFWTGFYLLNKGQLIVGPYQGPVACMILEQNKGVCWHTINTRTTTVVPDVHQFPGHIACDSRSNSEIVIPVKNIAGEIIGVLDIDSKDYHAFDETDAAMLERIVALIYHPAS